MKHFYKTILTVASFSICLSSGVFASLSENEETAQRGNIVGLHKKDQTQQELFDQSSHTHTTHQPLFQDPRAKLKEIETTLDELQGNIRRLKENRLHIMDDLSNIKRTNEFRHYVYAIAGDEYKSLSQQLYTADLAKCSEDIRRISTEMATIEDQNPQIQELIRSIRADWETEQRKIEIDLEFLVPRYDRTFKEFKALQDALRRDSKGEVSA